MLLSEQKDNVAGFICLKINSLFYNKDIVRGK